jgi:hypothetical protein
LQHRLRSDFGGWPLRRAVRLAVQKLFTFTHRDRAGGALWSRREQVWLGRSTFLQWALHEAAIDVPWLVSQSDGAPSTEEELETVVREELVLLWTHQLASLPSKTTPKWLPLP